MAENGRDDANEQIYHLLEPRHVDGLTASVRTLNLTMTTLIEVMKLQSKSREGLATALRSGKLTASGSHDSSNEDTQPRATTPTAAAVERRKRAR